MVRLRAFLRQSSVIRNRKVPLIVSVLGELVPTESEVPLIVSVLGELETTFYE